MSEGLGENCGGVSGRRSGGSGRRAEVSGEMTGEGSGVVSGERSSGATGVEEGVECNSGEEGGERYSTLSQSMEVLRYTAKSNEGFATTT